VKKDKEKTSHLENENGFKDAKRRDKEIVKKNDENKELMAVPMSNRLVIYSRKYKKTSG